MSADSHDYEPTGNPSEEQLDEQTEIHARARTAEPTWGGEPLFESGGASSATSAPSLGRQPDHPLPPSGAAGAQCSAPGCRRLATKSSGYVWCYWCSPEVPIGEKRAALQLGGRRGAMSASEV